MKQANKERNKSTRIKHKCLKNSPVNIVLAKQRQNSINKAYQASTIFDHSVRFIDTRLKGKFCCCCYCWYKCIMVILPGGRKLHISAIISPLVNKSHTTTTATTTTNKQTNKQTKNKQISERKVLENILEQSQENGQLAAKQASLKGQRDKAGNQERD